MFYDGLEGGYLSALAAAERFAMLAGCDSTSPFDKDDVDLVENIDGAETSAQSWPGCVNGSEVDFWTINDGPHIPGPWVPSGLDRFVDWMLSHPRD